MTTWSTYQFRAMGTDIHLWLDSPPEVAGEPFAHARQLFEDVEQCLSRFRHDSELSKLNKQAGQMVRASRMLWDVLILALDYAEDTNGLFDPTLLNAVESAGYTITFDHIGSGGEGTASDATPLPGRWQEIEVDEMHRGVKLPHGVGLDFGGIAKSYTAGWAAQILGLWGPCMVNAGGDIAAGDAPHGRKGWPVEVGLPRVDGKEVDEDLVKLLISNETLATSGIDHRRWRVNGRWMHHIIDPRTGKPAQTDALTVTTLGKTGPEAEIWSKLLLIEGVDEALKHSTSELIPALIVDQNRHVHINHLMQERIGWINPEIIQIQGALINE